MTICVICDCEFSLPKNPNKQLKQYHSTDEDGYKQYMCGGCFHERANADYRYIDGVMLCANLGCGRNAMVLSKYCEICANEQEK